MLYCVSTASVVFITALDHHSIIEYNVMNNVSFIMTITIKYDVFSVCVTIVLL